MNQMGESSTPRSWTVEIKNVQNADGKPENGEDAVHAKKTHNSLFQLVRHVCPLRE